MRQHLPMSADSFPHVVCDCAAMSLREAASDEYSREIQIRECRTECFERPEAAGSAPIETNDIGTLQHRSVNCASDQRR